MIFIAINLQYLLLLPHHLDDGNFSSRKRKSLPKTLKIVYDRLILFIIFTRGIFFFAAALSCIQKKFSDPGDEKLNMNMKLSRFTLIIIVAHRSEGERENRTKIRDVGLSAFQDIFFFEHLSKSLSSFENQKENEISMWNENGEKQNEERKVYIKS
jgi:hypothetical protein